MELIKTANVKKRRFVFKCNDSKIEAIFHYYICLTYESMIKLTIQREIGGGG